MGRPVIGQLQWPPDFKLDFPVMPAQIYVNQDFNATPDNNGNFSIDDVPPGDYHLSALFPDCFQTLHRFTVPKVDEKPSQRPVDLGVLTLELIDPSEVRTKKIGVPTKSGVPTKKIPP